MSGRTVAVLGATGCVGRQVCATVARAGGEVLAVARHPAAHIGRYGFAALDVAATPAPVLAELLEGVDAVVNATGGWAREEADMAYAHVRLVERLVQALRLLPRPPRLVHLGTIHEYGPIAEGVLIHEGIEPRPATPYARTKQAGSQVVLDAADLDAIVLRAVNVCGPYTTEASFLGMVTGKLRALLPGEPLQLTIAPARRDYLDVRDLADAVVRAIGSAERGRAVNIGRGVAVELRELVRLLVAAAGFPPEVLQEQHDRVESKGGDWTRADITLAGRLLGWRPVVGLDESLRDMWTSFDTQEHR
ncbi:hypothetical protein GCM10010156_17650 [Planobispora rosea]|uniref:NAD-dependent epimerase/dehydratase domain-containing protein n=1 Tax=Planobispora rosea TaxID=35762 RepID=A0A8J3RWZ1_PLARO|nr:NAD(P)-dependent oxidoreductase [Planobispora rosea]GGS59381.1 hypothetical protein GCM10010156_17650 [Planobispora rosea]GIH84626.1 hypothetical protein Pro02_30340 [Planobispora rosea]